MGVQSTNRIKRNPFGCQSFKPFYRPSFKLSNYSKMKTRFQNLIPECYKVRNGLTSSELFRFLLLKKGYCYSSTCTTFELTGTIRGKNKKKEEEINDTNKQYLSQIIRLIIAMYSTDKTLPTN